MTATETQRLAVMNLALRGTEADFGLTAIASLNHVYYSSGL